MTAVIFLNGHYGEPAFYLKYLKRIKKPLIVCADGGLIACDEFGLRPDLIVGDLDSAPPELVDKYKSQGVEVVKFPAAKDETDGEIAVLTCLKRGDIDAFVFFGAQGGRFDHAFSNLFLLNHLREEGIAAEFADPGSRFFLVDTERSLELPVGTTVSVLAYSDEATGINLEGFRWPLVDARMNHRIPGFGISNVTARPRVRIAVAEGILLVGVMAAV